MSIAMINKVKVSGIKPTARLVAFLLADHHNDSTGLCFPSIPTLAAETGLSERSVIRALEELEGSNQIRINKSVGKSSKYILLFPPTPDSLSPLTESHPCHSVTTTPDRESPHPCHAVTTPLTACHPNHKEPEEKRKVNHNDVGFALSAEIAKINKAKPSNMAELIAYSLSEGGNESEAQDFFDKMEAKGWIVGKAKVKDWKAQFRTYHRNGWLNANSSPASRPKSTYVPPRAPEVTWEQHFWDMWDGTKEEGENAVRRRRESFAHFNINIDEH
jgi:hypothetical protein